MSLAYVTFGVMCGVTAGLFAVSAGADPLTAVVVYGGTGACGVLGFSLPFASFDWTKKP